MALPLAAAQHRRLRGVGATRTTRSARSKLSPGWRMARPPTSCARRHPFRQNGGAGESSSGRHDGQGRAVIPEFLSKQPSDGS